MTALENSDGQSDELDRVKSAALRLLSVRPRSTGELSDRLAERFPRDIVELVIQELTRAGLLDDSAFACQWVTERHRMKLLGPRRLERELRGFGLDGDVIADALACLSPEDEAEAARQLCEKWRRENSGRSGPAARASLRDYLVRRGYGDDVIKQAVQGRCP